MSKPSVTALKYWNGRGLMDAPRMMMAIAGKPYNDVRIGDGPGLTPKAKVSVCKRTFVRE